MGDGPEEGSLNGNDAEKPKRSCWIDRTELEKGLSLLLVVAVLLVSTLVILLFLYTKTSGTEEIGCGLTTSREELIAPRSPSIDPTNTSTCDTLACQKEALEILTRIEPRTNPCVDFYTFSCRNAPKLTQRHQYYGPFTPLIQQAKAIIEEMYSEPLRSNDHSLVQVQKTLYRGCLNESAISNEALATISQVLKELGGWSVVEGSEWDNRSFDLLNTTYKLRELGYFHEVYLQLDLVEDPDDSTKYILQVSIPEINDIYSKWFDSDEKNGFLADVTAVFGAQLPHNVAQMGAMYQFLEELQWQRREMSDDVYRLTIGDFQKREATIDWLKFISRVGGPNIKVNKNTFVLFPSERDVDAWFGLLMRTSKQTLSNYMLWKVIEEAFPYLTEALRKGRVRPRMIASRNGYTETRSEFCINQIRKIFSPNPIEVMYVRRYLPKEKRNMIKTIIENMNLELLEIVKNLKWMTVSDKDSTIKTIRNVNLVIGAFGNYFNDQIFKNLNFNLNKNNKQNFLQLLAQARKVNLDRKFGLLHASAAEFRPKWDDILSISMDYFEGNDNIYVPAGILQGQIFNENRPNYLNYANLGLALKYVFLRILGSAYHWSSETEEASDEIRQCFIREAKAEKATIPNHMIDGLLAHNLALKISYAAYKKYNNKTNGEESLGRTDFTPEQLFWLSSGYLYCQYTSPYFISHLDNKTAEDFIFAVKESINNNPNLKRDFGCSKIPIGVDVKCKIY